MNVGMYWCRIVDRQMHSDEGTANGMTKGLLLEDKEGNELLAGVGVQQCTPQFGINQVVFSVSGSLAPRERYSELPLSQVAAWLCHFLGQPVEAAKTPFQIENLPPIATIRHHPHHAHNGHGTARCQTISMPSVAHPPATPSGTSAQPELALPFATMHQMHASPTHVQNSPHSAVVPTTTSTAVRDEAAACHRTARAAATAEANPPASNVAGVASDVCLRPAPFPKQTRAMTRSLRRDAQPCGFTAAAERLASAEAGTMDTRLDAVRNGGERAACRVYTELKCAPFPSKIFVLLSSSLL